MISLHAMCIREDNAFEEDDERRRHRWVIDGIPDLGAAGREPAMRFVHLVDVLYDRDIPTHFIGDLPRDLFGRAGTVPPGTPRLLSRLGQLSVAQTCAP